MIGQHYNSACIELASWGATDDNQESDRSRMSNLHSTTSKDSTNCYKHGYMNTNSRQTFWDELFLLCVNRFLILSEKTFWTTETTLQFDLNLTKQLNETINIQLPNIISLETPLNSHQQLCVNSILPDSEQFMNMDVHWMEERTIMSGKTVHWYYQ